MRRLLSFPHPRFGRLAIPHWDNALTAAARRPTACSASGEPYARDPYYFSDIGPLRIQQVGLAADAVEWADEDGLIIGRDAAGSRHRRPVPERPGPSARGPRAGLQPPTDHER